MTPQLTRDQIARLKAFARARELNVQQLKLAMGAPFTWNTLYRALLGKPMHPRNYRFVLEFMKRHIPAPEIFDGKAAAAGEMVER